MAKQRKKNVPFRFGTRWVVAMIVILAMSLTVFSASAFAADDAEAGADVIIADSGGGSDSSGGKAS